MHESKREPIRLHTPEPDPPGPPPTEDPPGPHPEPEREPPEPPMPPIGDPPPEPLQASVKPGRILSCMGYISCAIVTARNSAPHPRLFA